MMTTMESKLKEQSNFWEVPLSKENIYFVDSPKSTAFQYLLFALENSTAVGLDAEWKPVTGQTAGASSPRISILQIASRFYDYPHSWKEMERLSLNSTKHWNNEVRARDASVTCQESREEGCILDESKEEEFDIEEDNIVDNENLVLNVFAAMSLEEIAERDERHKENFSEKEAVFILDMLILPPRAFNAALRNLLRCSKILKLGFKFQQDLLYLADSFPGSDSEACFHKAEPYVDVGKLYRHIVGSKFLHKHRGKKIFGESISLATVCEAVLGASLCKDMQCSNWEQRPLTTEQITYAAADAYCLLAIYDALKEKALRNLNFCEGGQAEGQTMFSMSPKVGIAELLQPAEEKDNADAGIVFQQKNGLASSIFDVRFTNASPSWYRIFEGQRMSISMAVQVSPEIHSSYVKKDTSIIEKFGERLLAYGRVEAAKSDRRKARSRRARQAGRRESGRQVDDDVVWQGPPPWDPTIGGDGSPKFLCDSMIEGLARQLRCVGIDTAYPRRGKVEARELVEQAQKEGRVLLTRDMKLLHRHLVPPNLAYRVKSLPKQDQLAEIIKTFKLTITEDQLLSRCIKCNGELVPDALTLEEALSANPWDQVFPPLAHENGFLFWQCSVCRHLYWQGQQFHHAMKQFSTICNGLPSL
ncbi:hypothetical protein O6H91_10G021400 [Diphasiastrum complanatum]|uniref:Uncharacterized protein n=1 Tax=Diphasiastrum complanatum TaxID=34168 RepID=A0ACC2CEV7_DIPCM|nr:hypothetical protein O6H91_10G021400 [Diphasiastrum complanatum]